MNKGRKFLTLSMLTPCIIGVASCSKKGSLEELVYNKDNVVIEHFDGLGVEWGTYEAPDKLSSGSWERSLRIMDRLNPQVARVMLNYDWFITNADDHADYDKDNDTWDYNFSNKLMDNTIDILRYCDEHQIDVAFGCWNVPGHVDIDEYDMFTEVTSDIRWAKMTADILEYLVKVQGIRSIKYFVNSNEPNYTGLPGKSKNYNNTFAIWSKGVKNVRAALDARGLNNIGIVGGDTTNFEGTDEYFSGISQSAELRQAVGDYGFHVYAPNRMIDLGTLGPTIKGMYDKIKGYDGELGVSRRPHIWEAGLLDGKDPVADSNGYIMNFSYGLRMADYTIQSALAGVTSVVYWDFDDAMHFMYHDDGTMTSKGWGMFSSLGTDSAVKQKIRPWFHSSTLLTNLMRRGSKIIDSGFNDPSVEKNFRSLGVIGPDNSYAGVAAVNRGAKPVHRTFTIDQEFNDSGKVYVYLYNQDDLELGQDGFVKYNEVIDASLRKTIEIDVPGDTLLVLSSKEL